MIRRKQIKASVLAVLMLALFSIGCSKDDDTQPQTETETPGEETPTGEVDKAPEISAQTFTAKEDVADDTVIGTVVATDPEGKALAFTLTKNSDDLFELTDAGELSLAADKKLDFETVTSYTLTVEVSDGKNKVNADITVTVENVAEPFITTWKTTMANETITFIQDKEGSNYKYTIDWGDGTVEDNQNTTKKHTYATAGTYTVSISGVFPMIKTTTLNDAEKLHTIEQWGDNVWEGEALRGAFIYCKNMTYKATDVPNLSKATILTNMFSGCHKFNGDINNWDVSTITNTAGMFGNCREFDSDLDNWDVSNVIDMRGMFSDATKFNGNISTWNVSKVTNMSHMFIRATSFNSDISGWDVGNVGDMQHMLNQTRKFTKDISKWNVSKVTNMQYMFFMAVSFNIDIGSWNVSNVTNMRNMFDRASIFNVDISNWDVSKVRDMRNMLDNSGLSTTNYDALLTKWAVLPNLRSNVTLGAQGLTYCGATTARNSLINDKNWTIIGDRDCPR